MIIMKFGTILNDEGLTKMNKVANSDSCVRPYDNHAERSGGSCDILQSRRYFPCWPECCLDNCGKRGAKIYT